MASAGDARDLAVRFVRDYLTFRPDEAVAFCAESNALAAAIRGDGAFGGMRGEGGAAASFVADAVGGLVGVRMGMADAPDRMDRALQAHRAESALQADLDLSMLAALVAFGLTRPQDVRSALSAHLHRLDPVQDRRQEETRDTGLDPMSSGGAEPWPAEAVDPGRSAGTLLAQLAWSVGLADAWVGDLPRGTRYLRLALDLAGDGLPVVAALAHLLLGKALALRGEIVEARFHLVVARELAASTDGIELGNGHLESSVYLPLVVGDDEGYVAMLELLAAEGRGRLSGLAPEYRLELATAVGTTGDRERARLLSRDLLGPSFAGRPVSAMFRAWAEWVSEPDSPDTCSRLAELAIRPADPAENLPAVRATWLLGSHSARRGRRGEAIRLLESAAERCTAMGALGYVRRIEAEIALLVQPEGPVPTRSRASSGDHWAADQRSHGPTGHQGPNANPSRLSTLTPGERRVAHAVARGLSNREVAELLVLSERTVETHLSSIFRKLGVRNRTELALRL